MVLHWSKRKIAFSYTQKYAQVILYIFSRNIYLLNWFLQSQAGADVILLKRKESAKAKRAKILPFVLYIGNLIDDGKLIHDPQANRPPTPAEVEITLDAGFNNRANVSTSEGGDEAGRSVAAPEVYVCTDDQHKFRVPSNSLIDAVDACFKTIILLSVDYSPRSKEYLVVFPNHL